MTNATFVNRITEVDQTDYISLANDQINKNGTIDVDGTIFQNALNQYNEGIIKGSVERLDVPEGFCGYIDPDTGRFRVEPDPFVGNLRSGTLYPDNATNPNDVPPLPVTTYPIDQCLAVGLPGSYKYTTGRCGIDDGDKLCSGMNWFGGSGGTETCGTGGGINSNVGLAGSNQQQGPEPAGPQGQGSGAWLYADKEARRLYPDERSPEDIAARRFPTCVESGAGFVNGIRHDTGNPDVSVFDYRFNVNDPKWKQINVGILGFGGINIKCLRGTFRPGGLQIIVWWNVKTDSFVNMKVNKIWKSGEITNYSIIYSP